MNFDWQPLLLSEKSVGVLWLEDLDMQKNHEVMVRLVLYSVNMKSTLHVNLCIARLEHFLPTMILFQLIAVCISTVSLTCCGRSHVLVAIVI